MGWWMMRGAFYENITWYVFFLHIIVLVANAFRPWIGGIANKLNGAKPILDIVGGLLDDL